MGMNKDYQVANYMNGYFPVSGRCYSILIWLGNPCFNTLGASYSFENLSREKETIAHKREWCVLKMVVTSKWVFFFQPSNKSNAWKFCSMVTKAQSGHIKTIKNCKFLYQLLSEISWKCSSSILFICYWGIITKCSCLLFLKPWGHSQNLRIRKTISWKKLFISWKCGNSPKKRLLSIWNVPKCPKLCAVDKTIFKLFRGLRRTCKSKPFALAKWNISQTRIIKYLCLA